MVEYEPGCSTQYWDGVSESAAHNVPGHSRSASNFRRTYNSSSSRALFIRQLPKNECGMRLATHLGNGRLPRRDSSATYPTRVIRQRSSKEGMLRAAMRFREGIWSVTGGGRLDAWKSAEPSGTHLARYPNRSGIVDRSTSTQSALWAGIGQKRYCQLQWPRRQSSRAC